MGLFAMFALIVSVEAAPFSELSYYSQDVIYQIEYEPIVQEVKLGEAAGEGPVEQMYELLQLFSFVGSVQVVPHKLMNAGMQVSGCGIAYAMRYVRAMMQGAVELGLRPDEARQAVLQTMKGAVTLLQESGSHPEQAIDAVTTPGGYTIRGLNAMEEAGFTRSVLAGLKANEK